MAFLESLGDGAKVPHALAAFRSGSERPLLVLHEALMRGDSPFTPGQRELIGAFVSAVNRCAYCTGSHRAVAAHFGLAPELIDRLIEDPHGPDVEPSLAPMLQYARKLTLTPAQVTQADVDAVVAAGWSERALYDVVQITALFNYMNRFVEGLGLEAIPEDFDREGRTLHDKGYTGLLKAFDID